MIHISLTQQILSTCRGRTFNSIEELAAAIPDAAPHVVEAAAISAIRHGLLRGRIDEQQLLDGPIVTVSAIGG